MVAHGYVCLHDISWKLRVTNSPVWLINKYLGHFDRENWASHGYFRRAAAGWKNCNVLTLSWPAIPAELPPKNSQGNRVLFQNAKEKYGRVWRCQCWKWGLPEVVTDQTCKADNAVPRTDNIPSSSVLKIDFADSIFSMSHSVIHMAFPYVRVRGRWK